MRIAIVAWLLTSAILTSGAVLASLAQNFEFARTVTFATVLRE
jgi:hypothetical protein